MEFTTQITGFIIQETKYSDVTVTELENKLTWIRDG